MDSGFQRELRGLTRREIETALRKLCEPLGGLRSVLFQKYRKRDELCFIELNVAERKTRLHAMLDGMEVGGCFVVRIPHSARAESAPAH
jgi:hypothetical protein